MKKIRIGKSELVPANMTYEEWHKKYAYGNIEDSKKMDIKFATKQGKSLLQNRN